MDLPSVYSVNHWQDDDLEALKYLLWGSDLPPIAAHEGRDPALPLQAPQVIIQVIEKGLIDLGLAIFRQKADYVLLPVL